MNYANILKFIFKASFKIVVMSVKERLVEYLEYKELNKSQFCRSIGVSSAYISSMVTSIQPDKIERITLNYPDLNITWLLSGEGAMLNGDEEKTIPSPRMVEVTAEAWDVIKKQAESLASKDRQVEELIMLLKKNNAHQEENAGCAAVSSSDLVK